MKKITLVLVTLAFAVGIAAAEDLVMSVNSTVTAEWGFGGQLIDNTGSFLDEELPSSDFFSDGGDIDWGQYPELTFTASVEDGDGNVIVEAATKEVEIDLTTYPTPDDWDMEDKYTDVTLDYIRFPNVVPGLLGISLMGPDDLDPAYSPADSTSKNERILVNITPIPQLDATVGLLVKPDNPLYEYYVTSAGTEIEDGLFVWPDTDDDDVDESEVYPLDATSWEIDSYLSWALSLEATFTQELSDEDSISVGFGTVLDSAFTNGVYWNDALNDTTKLYEFYTEDANTANENETEFLIKDMYGPIAVQPYTMKQMDPVSYGGDAADLKDLRDNEVLGRVTIPFGLGITADVAGITAAVDFQTRLADGKDENNYTGIEYVDFADWEKSTLDHPDYAMPIYAAVDLAYELALDGITITPGLNFKYSSDAWKWEFDDDDNTDPDDDAYVYAGDVSGADFVGRPMSIDIGVDVAGIAGMIDVGISAAMSLGDSVAGNHGLGIFSTFGIGNYVVSKFDADTGAIQELKYDNTLAEIIDFWFVQPTLADSSSNYWTNGTDQVAESGTDKQNNQWFSTGSNAMSIELSIDVTPPMLAGLSVNNTTTYMVDNAGIGYPDYVELDPVGNPGVETFIPWGEQLSSLTNETTVEYDWMVGDAVAFTIFGGLTYESIGFITEDGQIKKAFVDNTADSPAAGTLEFTYAEAPSMATFEYEVGVKVSLSL
jgi:hypothetical protein